MPLFLNLLTLTVTSYITVLLAKNSILTTIVK